MATLRSRVEEYVGDITDSDSLASLTEWLKAGGMFVVNILNPIRAKKIAQVAEWGDSYAISNGRIMYVTRDGYPARLVDEYAAPLVTTAESIHYARTDDPAYFIRGGYAFLYPTGGSTRYAYVVLYPNSITYASETIPGFTYDMEHGAVLFAALRACIKSLNTDRTSFNTIVTSIINDSLSITPNWPTADLPDLPNFSDISIDISSAGASTIAALGSDPVYTRVVDDTTFQDEFTESGLFTTDGRVNTALVAEDIELAQGWLQRAQAYLEKYQRNLLDNYNVFQKNLAIYQADMQKKIEQAKIDLQAVIVSAQIATDASEKIAALTLQKEREEYLAELQRYQAKVETEVQRIGALVAAHRANTEARVGTLQALAQSFQAAANTYTATSGLFNEHVKYLMGATGE